MEIFFTIVRNSWNSRAHLAETLAPLWGESGIIPVILLDAIRGFLWDKEMRRNYFHKNVVFLKYNFPIRNFRDPFSRKHCISYK